MRFIHTSDWHLGRLFFGEALTEEQAALLQEFTALVRESRPDAILVAGDVFDRSVPPADAVELLDEVLVKLVLEAGIPLLLISGNHDSGPRLSFGGRFFDKNHLHVCSSVLPETVTLQDRWGPVDFVMLPYADTAAVRLETGDAAVGDADAAVRRRMDSLSGAAFGRAGRSIAVAHAFLAGGQSSESERPLSVGGTGAVSPGHFDRFDYVALGHLHRPQLMGGGRLAYSGSLMKYSFDESMQRKGVYCVELDAEGGVSQEFIPLRGRRDVRTLEGRFEDLMRGPRSGEGTQDYLSITLLDDTPVIQAVHRLRTLYPKTMEINYRYLTEARQPGSGQRPDHRGMEGLALFESFAEWSTQRNLSDRQRAVMAGFLTRAVEEEGENR